MVREGGIGLTMVGDRHDTVSLRRGRRGHLQRKRAAAGDQTQGFVCLKHQ
jgi:hypothetical protein